REASPYMACCFINRCRNALLGELSLVVSTLFVVATNANAAAPDIKVSTVAVRRCARIRFRLNERGIFIFVEFRDQLNFSNERGDDFSKTTTKSSRFLALHFCNLKLGPLGHTRLIERLSLTNSLTNTVNRKSLR